MKKKTNTLPAFIAYLPNRIITIIVSIAIFGYWLYVVSAADNRAEFFCIIGKLTYCASGIYFAICALIAIKHSK